MGPMVCTGLKKTYGDKSVVCQGVGGAYGATIEGNMALKGTTQGSIDEAKKMFNLADTKCGSSTLVFGGFRFVSR
jgi:cutinase